MNNPNEIGGANMEMIGLKVPPEVKKFLQDAADKEHRPLANMVRLLLYEGTKARYGVDFFKEAQETRGKGKRRG
jgi:hypothetical protein